MKKLLLGTMLVVLMGCGGADRTGAPTGNPSVSRAVASGSGLCPSPDPMRDGPLVDAIRRDDATSVEALLARNPDDTRARAALAIISGRGQPDPNEAACFAPYLT